MATKSILKSSASALLALALGSALMLPAAASAQERMDRGERGAGRAARMERTERASPAQAPAWQSRSPSANAQPAWSGRSAGSNYPTNQTYSQPARQPANPGNWNRGADRERGDRGNGIAPRGQPAFAGAGVAAGTTPSWGTRNPSYVDPARGNAGRGNEGRANEGRANMGRDGNDRGNNGRDRDWRGNNDRPASGNWNRDRGDNRDGDRNWNRDRGGNQDRNWDRDRNWNRDRDGDGRRDRDNWRGRQWSNNDWRGNNWRGNGWQDNRWNNNRWANNGWRGNGWNNNRWSNNNWRAWDRDRWRRDNRYDWLGWRNRHRSAFSIGFYSAPWSNWSYSRFNIGVMIGQPFFDQRYWIADPWAFRLPPADGPYRWVRYYNDALLVDLYSGEVVDAVYDIFW